MNIQSNTNNNYSFSRTINEISSGKKSIVSAPSEIAIGDRLNSMLKSLQSVNKNLSNASSYSKTIDGAMQHTGDALGRLKELSIQANSGILSDGDRESINSEAKELISYINDQSNNMSFNGRDLLKGGSLSIAVDANGSEMNLENPDTTISSLGIDTIDLSTQAGASNAIASIDNATNVLSKQRVVNASQEKVINEMSEANNSYQSNLYEASSKLTDVDRAKASTSFTSGIMMQKIKLAMQAQVNNLTKKSISRLNP